MRIDLEELKRVANLHVEEIKQCYMNVSDSEDAEDMKEQEYLLRTVGSIEEIEKVLKSFTAHVNALYEDFEDDTRCATLDIF